MRRLYDTGALLFVEFDRLSAGPVAFWLVSGGGRVVAVPGVVLRVRCSTGANGADGYRVGVPSLVIAGERGDLASLDTLPKVAELLSGAFPAAALWEILD